VERFRLGFANRTLGYRLPAKNRKEGAAIRERLQALGAIRGSGHEHLNGSLVVPVFDEENYNTAIEWYKKNYPDVIEGKSLTPVQNLRETTGYRGVTVAGRSFIDSDMPVVRIVGTIRHETLHQELGFLDSLRMGLQDVGARVQNAFDPTVLPYGEMHNQIYLEGDRFEQLYRNSIQP